MDTYEITGLATGVSQAGVNYLQPSDSFQNIENGFINRQVLQSRQGVSLFTPRLEGETRVFGIIEFIHPDQTIELLAFDQNNLYSYNSGTNTFDLMPFGGSMAAYTGFNIASKDAYISGTSYPDKDNNPRFVFCSTGITPNANGSAIFFYDGTEVLDYTDGGDNPDYAAPPMGALTSAKYVLWFNGRINFVVPTINAITFNNGVLYSAIRDASGNGDKFNVAGSGVFVADTDYFITGASILGQIIVLNFNRMAYVLEKTRDPFNPYFGRQVPGPLGTNADFSAVVWDDIDNSIGKTGILGTDGRQNLRIDNKIPLFTEDQIDAKDFNLTYGGFDRQNNLFLWAYKETESDTETQNRVLVQNYQENSWSFFDQRFSVFGQTDLGIDLTWDDIDETSGNESWAQWDTTSEIWDKIGLGEAIQKTLAGDDLGFIYQLNQDYDDYFTNISAITTGATTTLTVSDSGILEGDLLAIANVIGLLDENGDSGINNFDYENNEPLNEYYTVLSATTTSIVINLDSTLLTAYVSGGSVSKPISFYAETIPFNPYRSQGRRCFVSHIELLIDNNGGSARVDVYADEQETPFKQDVLLKPSSFPQAREWITMTVDQEANFLTFAIKQVSPSSQYRQTSMRIHCSPGGLTSG